MENKKIIILWVAVAVLLFVIIFLAFTLSKMSKKYLAMREALLGWEKNNESSATVQAAELTEEDANIIAMKAALPPQPTLMLGGNLSYRIGYDPVTMGYIVEPTKGDTGRFVFYFREGTQRYEFYKADFDPELQDEGALNPVQILSVQLIPGTDPTALVKSAIASIIKNNDKN